MVMKVSENGTDICQDDMGSMEETPEDTILFCKAMWVFN